MSNLRCCDTIGPIAPRLNKDPSKPNDPILSFTLSPEKWRFYMYVCFWTMSGVATIVSNIFVKPLMAAGPPDGSPCPPFDRNLPDLAGGVYPGKGFDVVTQNHIVAVVGFSNICTNWDYSPSREIAALIYPLMEYSFLIYLCLDFASDKLANERGELTPWAWTVTKICFPINFFLVSEFRMVFIWTAYESFGQHCLAFFGLQIAMFLIALQNSIQVYTADVGYPFCDWMGGGVENRVRNTKRGAIIYMVVLSSVTFSYLFLCAEGLFRYRTNPILLMEAFNGVTVGMILDKAWLFVNMFVPLVIAYNRAQHDYPLKFDIGQNVRYFEYTEGGEESRPLRPKHRRGGEIPPAPAKRVRRA